MMKRRGGEGGGFIIEGRGGRHIYGIEGEGELDGEGERGGEEGRVTMKNEE